MMSRRTQRAKNVMEIRQLSTKLRETSKAGCGFAGSLFPNLSISIGYVPKKKVGSSEKEYMRSYEEQFDSYEVLSSEYGCTKRTEVKFIDKKRPSCRLDKGSKLSQKRRKYGEKGITGYGKKMVSSGVVLLERKFTVRKLGFYTATIPPLAEEDIEILREGWGEIVRRFFQSLSRAYSRRGCKLYYSGVTEIQPKRFEKTGIAVPHLHWVANAFRGNSTSFCMYANDIRRIWEHEITSYLSKKRECSANDSWNWSSSVDCKIVKKSAASYLGKYMSKGAEFLKEVIKKGGVSLPSQWWFASKPVKEMVKDAIIQIKDSVARDIFYNLQLWVDSGLLSWGEYVYADIAGVERKIGIAAKANKKTIKTLEQILQTC